MGDRAMARLKQELAADVGATSGGTRRTTRDAAVSAADAPIGRIPVSAEELAHMRSAIRSSMSPPSDTLRADQDLLDNMGY